MSDAPFSRGLRPVPALPGKRWMPRVRALAVGAADLPGLLAILALAVVILVGSVMAIGACLIPG